ncbi:uncharacterized protein LOC119404890 isoform X1 [Rhipicephalus sanguineus]|uniref:uncharacterized protein LOC119404890 isoform X1 n=1 Tax=Rhipicephalus sanguineus TaxID=34632 RepID=UPI0020C32680|nr:uncharacterized protein LOC119404890 isoform X1 [Rhipicephalus sanguineus]
MKSLMLPHSLRMMKFRRRLVSLLEETCFANMCMNLVRFQLHEIRILWPCLMASRHGVNGDQRGVKVTEHDVHSDHEEMLHVHRDSKTNAKRSSTKGREKHGGHTDDSTESFSSSLDDEVVEKAVRQATSDDAAKAPSSVSDAEVAAENGGQNLLEDAAVTLSKSDSESSGQPLLLTPVEAGDMATVITMKKARRSRIVISSESSDEEHSVKHSALEAEPARAVKQACRSRTFISSEFSDEDHSAERLPLQKAESTDEGGVVEDLEQEDGSSDNEGSVKQSAPQEAKSSEKRCVEHSSQQDHKPARAVKKARKSRTFISSESSDEHHSVEHLPLHKAESTDEGGVVEDLEQEAESSDNEGSVKQSAPQEAKSSEKRCVEHSSQQDHKPARTVKKARKSRTFISSESSDEHHSVEHLPLHKAESSDEEGIFDHSAQKAEFSDQECSAENSVQEAEPLERQCIEHSAQWEVEPVRTVKKARRSSALISSESSDGDHGVEHSPLQKTESSDEEGSVEKSALQEPKSAEKHCVEHSDQREDEPVRTVKKARRSRALISSESSDGDHGVEHSPLRKTESSDEEGSVEKSALQEPKSAEKHCVEHSDQREDEPVRTVKKARRSRALISSESSDGDHGVEYSPLQTTESSDEEGSVEKSALQEPKSAEKHCVEHSDQREDEPVRTFQKARRSRTLVSSESSDEDRSVEHSPLQEAKSSNEEGSVDHSAQQEVEPARTVKKTRRSKTSIIFSKSSVRDDSVEHLPLQRAECSDEEGSVEHSAQQEVKPARTVKKTRRSKTSFESSDEGDSVEHLPLKKAMSSDEEDIVDHSVQKAEFSDQKGSAERSAPQEAESFEKRYIKHSAQREIKPSRTVKKAGRSKTVISSESSDEDHSAEYLPHQKSESSNEKGTVQLSAHEDESSDEENGVECSAPQKAVPSNSGSSVGHPAQQAKSSDKEVCVKHSATQEESSNEKGSVEDSALQEAEPSDGEGSVDHSTRQDAEFSDKCSVEHPAHPQPGQPAVFSEMADEIPCGQRSPCALSLLDMHLSPPESDKYNSLSPVIQGSHPAAESDADTLEIQSNDEGVASCRQRAPRLSQATTVSVSSQRRSPSPFSKLRERVMSFEEDSDDETDAVDFRRKKTSAALPQSPFKLPLLKKPGTSALCKSVKSKRQDGRCSSDKRNSPSKSQPARRRVRSRGSVSPQVKQVAMSNKWQVSVSDSDSADAATSDIASVSLRSSVVGSSNVSAAKAKDLSPGNKKASTRRNSPRTSLPTNKSSKLPEANKTSELERNGASGLDSDVCQEDENKPLVSGKQTRESPANVEKVVTLKTSLPNRRKDTPRPPPLTSDLALREKATLKLSSSHDSDGASVIVNKESGSSEHSRQNKDSAMQPLESVVSTRRLSARSCARRLVLGQQNEVSDSNSSSTCIDVNGRTVQSIDVASLSTGVERQDDSKNANLTPEKPCAPAKRSSGHLAHRIEASTRPGDLSDNGIEHDAPRKHPCPKSPTEMAISSMIKQKPGIEAVGASTSRTGQLASGSGYGSSPSPIRGKTPAYAVNETGQAKHGVLTRSARRQLSFAIDKTSLSKVGRTTRSSRVVGPDVESCGNSGDTTTKSRLRENIEPPPLKARRRVLQDSINDGDSVSDLLSTQGEEAITEKESENENKGVGSPSPTVTKCPAITVGRLQSNETESAATVSGSRNMPRTRSVTVSLKGREEVQVPSTTCDVSHASKQQLEGSNTGHIAGSSRSPLRTPSKRRRVAEAGANVTPPLETTERDLSQTNDGLGGLTQVPLLRNVNASSDSLSSNEEKEFVCAMRQRTQSLRRLPSRRCSQRNNEEDFVIDVDAMVRSFSDSDDGDPSYEVRETNLDASIARLRRLKVPLYALQEEQSRPQSAASSYKVASTSARRTGRLSLTAIRASQSENSASTQSSRSPRFSPAPTTSSGITDAQSPSSNFCTCQSPSRHTRSFGTGPIGAAMEKQAEQDVQSQFQSNVGAPPVHTDTATSAEKTPVLRRSTRVGTKRDTPAWPTRSNHLTSKVPAAAKGPRHPSKDLDVFTQEQTSRATKRSKNSKMSPLLKTHTEPSDESLNAAEQESVTDKASSAICSTCNRSVNSPSTQDSGTMTDDSYLHDEDAFSDSPRYSKRRKTAGHNASVSRPKAGAARSSRRHGAASQEASVPVRRSSRKTAGALRRLSYT